MGPYLYMKSVAYASYNTCNHTLVRAKEVHGWAYNRTGAYIMVSAGRDGGYQDREEGGAVGRLTIGGRRGGTLWNV